MRPAAGVRRCKGAGRGCGSVTDAVAVFNGSSCHTKSVVLWTALIGAYVDNGEPSEALRIYWRMHLEAKLVHSHIRVSGFSYGSDPAASSKSVKLGNALINAYEKCGCMDAARSVFEEMRERNLITWTSMVTAYAHNGHQMEALLCFREMQQQGIGANSVTFVAVLNACACVGCVDMEDGRFIHRLVVEAGLESQGPISNALINMYGKAGYLEEARTVLFKDRELKSIISWNTMMSACVQHDRSEEALELFKEVLTVSKCRPDNVSCILGLTACSNVEALEVGKQIHGMVKSKGLENETVVRNCLLHMYAKCGCLEEAVTMFEHVKDDRVSCNAMIGAFSKSGRWNDALRVFYGMQVRGMKTERVTFAALLDGCADSSTLAQGRGIHKLVATIGLELELVVGTALVNMYGKCGCTEEAQAIFDRMAGKNELSWNSLFGAYARGGHVGKALKLFGGMKQEGMKMHAATFVCVLSACSHAGLLEECVKQFVSMRRDHGMEAKMEHYGCIVDLLGRLGMLAEAERFMTTSVPGGGNHFIWTSFLASCRTHNDVRRAKIAAEGAEKRAPGRSASYIVLSNLYTQQQPG